MFTFSIETWQPKCVFELLSDTERIFYRSLYICSSRAVPSQHSKSVWQQSLRVMLVGWCHRRCTLLSWPFHQGQLHQGTALVLRALSGAPFEQISDIDLKPLSFKMALPMPLISVKHAGDLTTLSVKPACMQFAPGDTRVVLHPNPFYITKVLNTSFRLQVIAVLVLHSPTVQMSQASLHHGHLERRLCAGCLSLDQQ